MHTITATPLRDGYTVTPVADVLRVQHDGGSGRYRQGPKSNSFVVTVTWALPAADAFTLVQQLNDGSALRVPLRTTAGTGDPVEHIGRAQAGSVRVAAFRSNECRVSCQLVVVDATYFEAP